MRYRYPIAMAVVVAANAVLLLSVVEARQARGGAAGRAAAPAQIHGDLNAVMRGILFPNSNVIFSAQVEELAKFKPGDRASDATDPTVGVYGGWTAVENAGVAMAETANLLMLPGRRCSNGRPVPLADPEWTKFVGALREAGMVSIKASQARTEDALLEASDKVSTSCSDCHDLYRDRPAPAQRCVK